jgi:hypothetical protein
MRMILTVAGLLSALAAGEAGAATSDPVRLECRGGAVAEPLCAALRAELLRRGHSLAEDAPLRLVLWAEAPDPSALVARLDLEDDGQWRQGEPGTLAVIDRRVLPGRQLQDFAAALLDRAGPGFQ